MNMGNALKSALVVVSDMMVVARLQYSRRVVEHAMGLELSQCCVMDGGEVGAAVQG